MVALEGNCSGRTVGRRHTTAGRWREAPSGPGLGLGLDSVCASADSAGVGR